MLSLEPGLRAGTEIQLRAGKAKAQENRRALGLSCWGSEIPAWAGFGAVCELLFLWEHSLLQL